VSFSVSRDGLLPRVFCDVRAKGEDALAPVLGILVCAAVMYSLGGRTTGCVC
jgi:hypothetical protein